MTKDEIRAAAKEAADTAAGLLDTLKKAHVSYNSACASGSDQAVADARLKLIDARTEYTREFDLWMALK